MATRKTAHKKSAHKKTAKAKRTSASKAPKQDAALLESLRGFVRAKHEQLLNKQGVTSVGIGYKQVEGGPPELAIQFTVDAEAVPEAVGGESDIPKTIEVDGVQVPTEQIKRTFKPSYIAVEPQAKDPRKLRADVLAPGMSVGNFVTSAGTIGAFVRDRTTGNVVLLSNWHVLHGPSAQLGAEIVQPGRHDDNRVEQNRMGRLLRSHLGPAGDCAIASVTGRAISTGILDLGVPVGAIGDPELGDLVVKSGRTTAVTFGRVTRIEVNTRINYGGDVRETIGGFEIGIDDAHKPADGEISRGGDSGSAWMATKADGSPTDVMLGLHFAGDADGTTTEFALACYAKSVMTALEVEPVGDLPQQAAAAALEVGTRSGFDRNFLQFPIAPPAFSRARRTDLATLEDDTEIRYCHFSVWLSQTRKYPLCVAWNIDGARFKRVKRVSFRVDRRGDLEQHQFTNDLYVNNPFDKGHIARRADLCWGDDLEEARQANYDSFFFTNIVPQHEGFNQSDNMDGDPEGGVWGRLENTVFDDQAPHGLRVSLMAGPVFGKNDRRFEQNGQSCLIPDEFWKVVAYRDDEDGRDKVFGFLLTQRHLVDPLIVPEGLQFERWLWARVTLEDLENRTGVRFPKTLREHEQAFVMPELAGEPQPIRILASPAEYFA